MRTRLKQKQETFCVEYFEKGNAVEAALQAGYKGHGIRVTASRLLTKANIQARIAELREEVKSAAVMNVQERMERLTEIARASMIDFVGMGQDGAWFNIDKTNLNNVAIQSIQSKTVLGKEGADDAVFIRVNLHDPIKAIDLLNKMDKIYTDGYQDNRVVNRNVNIFVIDGETKDLIGQVGERTKLITNGHENN